MIFFIKDFFSKCALIDSVDLVTSTHLLRKSLMENFIFCAVYLSVFKSLTEQKLDNFCHEIVQRGILLPYFLILQKFELKVSFKWWLRVLVWREEISTCQARLYFTLRLHEGNQISFWWGGTVFHLVFVYICLHFF